MIHEVQIEQEHIDNGYLCSNPNWGGPDLMGTTCPLSQALHDYLNCSWDEIYTDGCSVRIGKWTYALSQPIREWIEHLDKYIGSTDYMKLEAPEPITVLFDTHTHHITLSEKEK